MRINRILCLILLFSIVFSATGCKKKSSGIPIQFTEGSGTNVARISFKDYGSIDIRLFENYAPSAVQSFISLAEQGYYNGKTVKSVIKDYCVLVGEASDSNSANTSSKSFDAELSSELFPFEGALCITEGSNISCEQFMLITSGKDFLSNLKELLSYKKVTPAEYYENAYGTKLSEEQLKLYDEYGGTPWLYGHCIIFGQVYEGFDVLKKLNLIEINEEADELYSPLEDVVIEYIEIK